MLHSLLEIKLPQQQYQQDSRIKRKLQPSLANAENNEAILQALFVRESNVKSN